jgi:hypothetical protein
LAATSLRAALASGQRGHVISARAGPGAVTMADKSPRTRTELEALVLAELRATSQCGEAVHVTVIPYDDYRVPATWEVASCDAGASSPEQCERALCDIVGRLQQHFDIAP